MQAFTYLYRMGKLLIIVGIVCIVIGLFITYGPKISLGRLPGDIVVERENVRFYFPVVTSIIVSIILSVLIYLFNRYKH